MKSSLILFFISYIVLFIIYLLFFYIRGLKKKSILNSLQAEFLMVRFDFKKKDLNPKSLGLIISLLDPLIISLTGTIVTLPKWHYALELMLGFVLLMALIFSFYEILGRILKVRINRK